MRAGNPRKATFLPEGEIVIGERLSAAVGPPQLVSEEASLAPFLTAPWFRAYCAQQAGLPTYAFEPLEEGEDEDEEDTIDSDGLVSVTHSLLARHTLICGSTGSGKTRLALHLILKQLESGCSLVMLDPKKETILHVLEEARKMGIPAERVTLLLPSHKEGGIPGWNLLSDNTSDASVVQAAASLSTLLAANTTSWGPRLGDLLANTLIVVGSHRLSLIEVVRFLQNEDYRKGLLATTPPIQREPGQESPAWTAYQEAHDYFVSEFGKWGKSNQADASAAVLNKVREMLRSPFLRGLLNAKRSTLRLDNLWQEQRLILVHLDSESLGGEAARLLGGLLSHALFREAMRQDKSKQELPVVLALDEMGMSEKFLGAAVGDIAALAREKSLRLLVACQHFSQLSDNLRRTLLANAQVKAFFQLGHEDAEEISRFLSVQDSEGGIETVTVRLPKPTAIKRSKRGEVPIERDSMTEKWEGYPQAEWSHPILDGSGRLLQVTDSAWRSWEAAVNNEPIFIPSPEGNRTPHSYRNDPPDPLGMLGRLLPSFPTAPLLPPFPLLPGSSPSSPIVSNYQSGPVRTQSSTALVPVSVGDSSPVPAPPSLSILLRTLSAWIGQYRYGRLYVLAADTGEVAEVGEYLLLRRGKQRRPEESGVVEAKIEKSSWGKVGGPGPLTLRLRFPRPIVSVNDAPGEAENRRRWLKTLLRLPAREAVVQAGSSLLVRMRVSPVPDVTIGEGTDRYVRAALAANGQSLEELSAVNAERDRGVKQLAGQAGGKAPAEPIIPTQSVPPSFVSPVIPISVIPKPSRRKPEPEIDIVMGENRDVVNSDESEGNPTDKKKNPDADVGDDFLASEDFVPVLPAESAPAPEEVADDGSIF